MSSFTLKILAIILMAMDHIYTYIGRTNLDIPIWFGYLGKLAAPIFFYLIVEGFYHTRSRGKYLTRLFGMGIGMIGVDIIFKIHNNVFLSLGFGVLLMWLVEYAKLNKENRLKRIIGVLGAILAGIVLAFFTEASIYGLAMILIFYFFRNSKVKMGVGYIGFSLFLVAGARGPHMMEQLFLYDYQWMMLFAIVPILMYNGELGISNKWIKWLFYWFYPLHLILIVTIANLIV